jgi:hypothetical protein
MDRRRILCTQRLGVFGMLVTFLISGFEAKLSVPSIEYQLHLLK